MASWWKCLWLEGETARAAQLIGWMGTYSLPSLASTLGKPLCPSTHHLISGAAPASPSLQLNMAPHGQERPRVNRHWCGQPAWRSVWATELAGCLSGGHLSVLPT